ncbi:STAS domain-containing protein [Nocardiopsis protaetiae]|uniref:STAS domain-containing protein n=1 Tax=Nocardiopsis protaetiae TaxID=3382270 RepID=UPI00387B376C
MLSPQPHRRVFRGFPRKKPPGTSLERLRSRTRLRSGKITSGERWSLVARDVRFQDRLPHPGVTVVPVDGEIDLATVPGLRARLAAAAREERCECLVVDLAGVGFLDASGVGALVAAHRILAARGARLVLARPRPAVARVLEILGMDRAFEIVPAPPVRGRAGQV